MITSLRMLYSLAGLHCQPCSWHWSQQQLSLCYLLLHLGWPNLCSELSEVAACTIRRKHQTQVISSTDRVGTRYHKTVLQSPLASAQHAASSAHHQSAVQLLQDCCDSFGQTERTRRDTSKPETKGDRGPSLLWQPSRQAAALCISRAPPAQASRAKTSVAALSPLISSQLPVKKRACGVTWDAVPEQSW